jgi:VanZ family protein
MTNPWKIRTLLLLAATAAYWLVMFVGTHLPGSVVHLGGHTDKLYHFGAFFGLAILLAFCIGCFRPVRLWQYAGIIGSVACYGVVDELTQTLAINRSADPLDWLADMCGIIAGVLIFALAARVFRSHESGHGATG